MQRFIATAHMFKLHKSIGEKLDPGNLTLVDQFLRSVRGDDFGSCHGVWQENCSNTNKTKNSMRHTFLFSIVTAVNVVAPPQGVLDELYVYGYRIMLVR